MQSNLTDIEILKKLIEFDTISHKSNMALISFVRNYMDGFGIKSKLIYDTSKKKANLYATIGDEDKAGLILSGHTDVVPVEGQDWHTNPFEMVEKDGLFYGRGSCDMKGFIAVALAKIPKIIEANFSYPISFALSYDEEVGCLGAHSIAEHIKNMGVKPKLCLVGEPTSMQVITGHKGVCNYNCSVHGKECHSSLAPDGVSAIEYAAELISYITKQARQFKEDGPFNYNFRPPFTTMHVGMIDGGSALNIVANNCEFGIEIRNIPEHNREEIIANIKDYAYRHLEPKMKDIDAKTSIKLRETVYTPSFDIEEEHPMVILIKKISELDDTKKVSFGTEAGIFHATGVPTVVCGPGSIKQAHKPNEFISYEQMIKCSKFLNKLFKSI